MEIMYINLPIAVKYYIYSNNGKKYLVINNLYK